MMSREPIILTPLGERFYALTVGILGAFALFATARVLGIVVVWLAG
jgi:hypothetical protein